MADSEAFLAEILPFVGGRLCVDFVNTVDWRTSAHAQELLPTVDVLIEWGAAAGIFTPEESATLKEAGHRDASPSATFWQQALRFRETLYRLFVGAIKGQPSVPDDLACFNDHLAEALRLIRLMSDGSALRLGWRPDAPTPGRLISRVAVAAAALMASDAMAYLRTCDGSGCGWLFVDTSKSHRRRWCDMKGCGNREKARRHYASIRRRGKTADSS